MVNTLHSQHLKDEGVEEYLVRAQGKEHGVFNSARSESPAVLKMPLPANIMEAGVNFLYKDDCGAVIKSEDQELAADVALHRGGLLLVSRDGKAGTGTYQQGKAPRANSKCE